MMGYLLENLIHKKRILFWNRTIHSNNLFMQFLLVIKRLLYMVFWKLVTIRLIHLYHMEDNLQQMNLFFKQQKVNIILLIFYCGYVKMQELNNFIKKLMSCIQWLVCQVFLALKIYNQCTSINSNSDGIQ